MKVEKPWGYYEDYYRDDVCVFKRIVVKPGQALSYQVHEHRNEVWFIAAGEATVKISPFDDESALDNYTMSKLSHGEYILVQRGTCHQILNNGDNDLHIFEMQFSPDNICSEDDIRRLDDPHNRQ